MKPREKVLRTGASAIVVLFSSVALIFMVMLFGVGGHNTCYDKNIQPINLGMPDISGNNNVNNIISGNTDIECSVIKNNLSDNIISNKPVPEENVSKNNDVPVAELAADFCIDTEPGVMVIDYVIPETLPLCITEDYLNENINITVYSYGGYNPDEQSLNMLSIYQPKTELGGVVSIVWVNAGTIICDNPSYSCYGCEIIKYEASFVLDEPIQIDSNHLPEVYSEGADCMWLCDGCGPSDDLNKWVFIGVVSSWEGCCEPDQKFKLILAQKSCFLGGPNSK